MILSESCKDCRGKCCTNPFLTTEEYSKLYNAIGEEAILKAQPQYIKFPGGWTFKAGYCPGLTESGCILTYDDRPLVCKTYPFLGYKTVDGKIALLLAVRTCPAWKEYGELYQEVYQEYEELIQ